MEAFVEHAGQKFKWEDSPDLKNVTVLVANETRIASLEIRGKLISDGTANWGSETWHFKRSGFFKNAVTIDRGDPKQEYARFKKNGTNFGGKLEFKAGRKLIVSVTHSMSEYILTNEQKDNLIVQHVAVKGRDSHTEVEIFPAAASIPDLSGCVLFVEFLSLMQHFDAAFNSAAAGAF
jgi:hypothetical protein